MAINLMEAIEARHSVRAYTDEPEVFDSTLAHYSKFSNVHNYLMLKGAG